MLVLAVHLGHKVVVEVQGVFLDRVDDLVALAGGVLHGTGGVDDEDQVHVIGPLAALLQAALGTAVLSVEVCHFLLLLCLVP